MEDDHSASLRLLRGASDELNALTDRANELIRRTERYLRDECHIGGTHHVHIPSMDVTAEMANGQTGPEWSTYLGYERYKGEHRIVVSHLVEGDQHELKPWAECSRDVKLKTLDGLPELIHELLETVNEQVADVRAKLGKLESMIPPADGSKARSSRGGKG
jgi:hypothetical protein